MWIEDLGCICGNEGECGVLISSAKSGFQPAGDQAVFLGEASKLGLIW